MGAGVDDAVHVEVEVVDGGDGLGGAEAAVEDVGVLVGQPAEHFGDAKEGGGAAAAGCGGWADGAGAGCVEGGGRDNIMTDGSFCGCHQSRLLLWHMERRRGVFILWECYQGREK